MTLPHIPRSRRRSPLPPPPPKDRQCHRRIPAADVGLAFLRCTEMNGHRGDHLFVTAAGVVRIPKGRG